MIEFTCDCCGVTAESITTPLGQEELPAAWKTVAPVNDPDDVGHWCGGCTHRFPDAFVEVSDAG